LYHSKINPDPPQGRSLKTVRERGEGCQRHNFKRKYEAKLEFPEGWGRETQCKNPLWEGHDYFLEQSNYSGFCSTRQCDKF